MSSENVPALIITVNMVFKSSPADIGGTQNTMQGIAFQPTPCGVGRGAGDGVALVGDISIHPSRAGWDFGGTAQELRSRPFQSTHPVRGGTANMYK